MLWQIAISFNKFLYNGRKSFDMRIIVKEVLKKTLSNFITVSMNDCVPYFSPLFGFTLSLHSLNVRKR